jgi:hypothetical protein
MDTFVVRVYRSGGQEGLPDDDRLRGVVEEISTGVHATFRDAKELLSILAGLNNTRPGRHRGRGDTPGEQSTAT